MFGNLLCALFIMSISFFYYAEVTTTYSFLLVRLSLLLFPSISWYVYTSFTVPKLITHTVISLHCDCHVQFIALLVLWVNLLQCLVSDLHIYFSLFLPDSTVWHICWNVIYLTNIKQLTLKKLTLHFWTLIIVQKSFLPLR